MERYKSKGGNVMRWMKRYKQKGRNRNGKMERKTKSEMIEIKRQT